MPRGKCPVCWCRHPLRKDGTLQRHYEHDRRFTGYEHNVCPGSGQKPEVEAIEQQLPTPSEIRGIAPDFTGNLSTEDYLAGFFRSLRDG